MRPGAPKPAQHGMQRICFAALRKPLMLTVGRGSQHQNKNHANCQGSGKSMNSNIRRYTLGAQKALAFAHEEVAQLKHLYIGPEHLLLGLVRANDGVAGDILKEFGLNAETLRQAIVAITPPIEKANRATHSIQLRNTTKEVLELATQVAEQKGGEGVRTEYLLLALAKQKDIRVRSALEKLGVTPDKILERLERA